MSIKEKCCGAQEPELANCEYCEDQIKIPCQCRQREMHMLKYRGTVEIYDTGKEIIVCGDLANLLIDGDPAPDEAHNCDEMGCSTVSHVVFRIKKAEQKISDDDLKSSCPHCGKEWPDYDGFGVMYCDPKDGGCGYCQHPAYTNGKCDLCGKAEEK